LNEVFVFAVVAIVSILSGATAAIIGFGIGSLLTPVLLTRLDPHLAISVVAVPHMAATAMRYVRHRRWVDRRVLVWFGLPSAVGGLAGALLQGTLHSPVLVVALAILLVLTGLANLTRGFGARAAPSPTAAGLVGLLSGICGGLVGNQGGLRAAGLNAFELEPRAYLATGTAVALLIDAARTPIYLARSGEALLGLVALIAVATIGCVVGTVAGERLFLRIPPERYRKVVGAAVVALGIWLLLRAIATD
jgi:uncharacterized membrane protein YfcA